MGQRKTKKQEWREREIKSAKALTQTVEQSAKQSKARPLEGGPANIDVARLLPHLRERPISNRPAWVERRVLQLGES